MYKIKCSNGKFVSKILNFWVYYRSKGGMLVNESEANMILDYCIKLDDLNFPYRKEKFTYTLEKII